MAFGSPFKAFSTAEMVALLSVDLRPRGLLTRLDDAIGLSVLVTGVGNAHSLVESVGPSSAHAYRIGPVVLTLGDCVVDDHPFAATRAGRMRAGTQRSAGFAYLNQDAVFVLAL